MAETPKKTAHNLLIANEPYTGIDQLSIPNTDGNKVAFHYVGDVTATADEVVNTVTFIDKDGELQNGSIVPTAAGTISINYPTADKPSTTKPSYTIPAKTYYPNGQTIEGISFYDLTKDATAKAVDLVQNATAYAGGGLITGPTADNGGLAPFPDAQYSENDKNTIIELTKIPNSADEMFVLKRITKTRGPDDDTGAAAVGSVQDGRFYIPNLADVGPDGSQYETKRIITNIYIPNLKPKNVLNTAIIAGMQGEYIAPIFNKTGTVLSIS